MWWQEHEVVWHIALCLCQRCGFLVERELDDEPWEHTDPKVLGNERWPRCSKPIVRKLESTTVTKYVEVERNGCVTITRMEAEFLNNPDTHMLDCDVVDCGWGLIGIKDESEASKHAQEHRESHAQDLQTSLKQP